MKDKLKILIAGAECVPFAKTGGLADVIGTLPGEIMALNHDIRVIMPKHAIIKEKYGDKLQVLAALNIQLGWRTQYLGIETMEYNGVRYYFIDNEFYFGHCIYKGGEPEAEQYAYFCKAVLESLEFINFEPDIIHCNDWHTAMIPMLIKTNYTNLSQGQIKTVFTIHNLQYQGQLSFDFVRSMLDIDERYFTPEYIEAYGCANMLKAALVFADKITTVSPTYAKEILDPYYGRGMQGILEARRDDLIGIVNGIDLEEYSPKSDKHLVHHYDKGDFSGKYKNKALLIDELNLNIEITTPIISVISRLTEQKGFELIKRILEELLYEDVAFVLLGQGDAEYENYFKYIASKYPDKTSINLGYSDELAHRIYASSDFFLMPSMFEPCGISQMISQNYGTLPIVRETGGLVDTVIPYDMYTKQGNGFSFKNYNAHEMLNVIRYAITVLSDKPAFLKLMTNAMETDNSFKKSAKQYEKLYYSCVEK